MAGAQKHLSREVKMGIFLNGPREEIQAELKVSQFRTLNDLMDKAQELEERNLAWKEGGVGNFQWSGGIPRVVTSYKFPSLTKAATRSNSASYGEKGGQIGVEGGGERRRVEPRRFSQEEWQE